MHTAIQDPPAPVARRRAGRWPSVLAMSAILLLSLTLPERLTVGPSWLAPLVEVVLLVPLTLTIPQQPHTEARWHRLSVLGLIAVLNGANLLSLGLLVRTLIHGGQSNGDQLIVEAMKIWLSNVLVFALWYWELDRGGPRGPSGPHPADPDFLFPQMTTPGVAPSDWAPSFVDYLYLSFTNSTAFSPTDTVPLTPWAKMLMLGQALASLLTVALVAARAVNILT